MSVNWPQQTIKRSWRELKSALLQYGEKKNIFLYNHLASFNLRTLSSPWPKNIQIFSLHRRTLYHEQWMILTLMMMYKIWKGKCFLYLIFQYRCAVTVKCPDQAWWEGEGKERFLPGPGLGIYILMKKLKSSLPTQFQPQSRIIFTPGYIFQYNVPSGPSLRPWCRPSDSPHYD